MVYCDNNCFNSDIGFSCSFVLLPFVPSFDYFRQYQNSCIPINSTKSTHNNIISNQTKFAVDLHNGVVYRGAPWKNEVGQWLAGCDSVTSAVKVIEQIGGKSCRNDCSGQGICNRELGQCRCFHGFTGEECAERQELSCNYPRSKEKPFGHWVVSICPAYCDTTRAMCFCGDGTKYPNRPLAETCGFTINPPSKPGGAPVTDFTKADLDVFTTNGSKRGWCNVDPEEAYASKVLFKEECDCKYDGLWGRFCEVSVLSTCINQCSGHGLCRGGFCQCDSGWFGTDCSVPSVLSSIREWPLWLRPAQVTVPENVNSKGNLVNLDAIVEKKRPLLYHVYTDRISKSPSTLTFYSFYDSPFYPCFDYLSPVSLDWL